MRPATLSFNATDYNATIHAGTIAEVSIMWPIEHLRKNMERKPELMDIMPWIYELPRAAAYELINPETDEDAYDLWLTTRFDMALEGIKTGVDIEQLKEETKLSLTALRALKSLGYVPKNSEDFGSLKEYAFSENYSLRKF
jgi:hypothetical protein